MGNPNTQEPRGPVSRVVDRFVVKDLREIFGLDLRSLALYRVALGFVVIFDLIDRARDLRAHYSDFGLLPRAPLLEKFTNPLTVCVHLVAGTSVAAVIAFVLQAIVALALVVGYRTRLMTVCSWFLMYSLHLRNPVVLQGGDDLLRMLLFWSIFLPLGARYSVDVALAQKDEPYSRPEGGVPDQPHLYFSLATVAAIGQVLLLYWSTAALKTGADWRADGTAVYFALSFEQLTTAAGMWLLNLGKQLPWLLPLLTHATWHFEAFGPFLLLSPFAFGPLRTAALFGFIAMHYGFAACMILGMFPWIDTASMLWLLPAWFWKGPTRLVPVEAQRRVTFYYDDGCDFCRKVVLIFRQLLVLPHSCVASAQSRPEILHLMEKEKSWVVTDAARSYTAWDAFTVACAVSPWARLFVPVMRSRIGTALGRRMYYFTASRRAAGSKITATWLPWRPLQLRSPYARSSMAFALFCLVAWWNIAAWPSGLYVPAAATPYLAQVPVLRVFNDTMGSPLLGLRFPDALRPLMYALRIDQDWGMFAPFPQKDDGWYVFPGRLVDGRQVDVFRHLEEPVSFAKPQLVSSMYTGQRWSKYMMNIWLARNAAYRLYFGQYLCRFWNGADNFKRPGALDTFEIIYMREDNLPDYQVRPAEKVSIWTHYCFEVPKG